MVYDDTLAGEDTGDVGGRRDARQHLAEAIENLGRAMREAASLPQPPLPGWLRDPDPPGFAAAVLAGHGYARRAYEARPRGKGRGAREGRAVANYVASARSNYFRVADPPAWPAFLAKWGLAGWERPDPAAPGVLVAFHAGDATDSGGWPDRPDPDWLAANVPGWDEGDAYEGPDLAGDLAPLLAPGQVAILQEIGYERLRYLTGEAVAVNGRGETRTVHLADIYALASELGDPPTAAEY